MIGETGTGKSAIACCFIFKRFRREYSVTLEDTYSKKIVVDEETIEIELLDTAGNEEYKKQS